MYLRLSFQFNRLFNRFYSPFRTYDISLIMWTGIVLRVRRNEIRVWEEKKGEGEDDIAGVYIFLELYPRKLR